MTEQNLQKAIFAAGCFWGVEYYLQKEPGVVSTRVGFTGGHVKNPSYHEVCEKNTGHYEAVEVTFDPRQTDYEKLARVFFEIHDFTQKDGQGPDIGQQYRSAIFYLTAEQKTIAEKLITELRRLDYKVATELLKADVFYPAEDYHQSYYFKNGHNPYCHHRRKIF